MFSLHSLINLQKTRKWKTLSCKTLALFKSTEKMQVESVPETRLLCVAPRKCYQVARVSGPDAMSLPNLAEHLHTPECVLVIRELHKCHDENPYGKYFGHCNELKALLRRCLTQQKEKRRADNRKKGVKVERIKIGGE